MQLNTFHFESAYNIAKKDENKDVISQIDFNLKEINEKIPVKSENNDLTKINANKFLIFVRN